MISEQDEDQEPTTVPPAATSLVPGESPSEKLQPHEPIGQQIPGAQNPESTEIKKEINPNTE